MIRLCGIAIKRVKRGPMELVASSTITERGLEGNYYGALKQMFGSHRLLSAISLDQWAETMKELGAGLDWYVRRANLCVSGYSFSPDDIGKAFIISNCAILRITGELDPCSRMDEIHPGLQMALRPDCRGGVMLKYVEGGFINVADEIQII